MITDKHGVEYTVRRGNCDALSFLHYHVMLGTRKIAYAEIKPGTQYISSVLVSGPFRRRGIASALYDYIEQQQHVRLRPSPCMLPDGMAFWVHRNPRLMRHHHPVIFDQIMEETLLPVNLDRCTVPVSKRKGVPNAQVSEEPLACREQSARGVLGDIAQ